MERERVLERIQEADMVLVGLGEDFMRLGRLRADPAWGKGRECLKQSGCSWLLPAWTEYGAGRLGQKGCGPALERLSCLLEGKNHYVVSVCMDSAVSGVEAWGERLVTPCGGALQKQCPAGCQGTVAPLTEADKGALDGAFAKLSEGKFSVEDAPDLGRCESCGSPMVLNNVYAPHYDETGYLDRWRQYTDWVGRTLHRKLFLLELGVGLQFPTVVRWPFEKMARYQQRTFLCRVHERLYQLPEDLAKRGCGIVKNPIDWLEQL